MIKNTIYILGVIALLLATTSTAQARTEEQTHSDEPQQIIGILQNALIKAMQQGKEMSYHDRETFLAPVLQQTHDLETIVRTILGVHWVTLDKTKQQDMISAFSQNSTATYADRFDQYDGERFEIIENRLLPRGRMLVRSQFIKADKGVISFDYVLHQQNEHWRIINIVIDGVSDLALKRAEYNAIIQQEGIQSLINTLQNKTNQIKLGHQQ